MCTKLTRISFNFLLCKKSSTELFLAWKPILRVECVLCGACRLRFYLWTFRLVGYLSVLPSPKTRPWRQQDPGVAPRGP